MKHQDNWRAAGMAGTATNIAAVNDVFVRAAAHHRDQNTGIAEVFTLSGRWHYREYPNQPQTAGSYLYEPASSVHTFITPADNTEDTVILVHVVGANINFTEDGQFHSILDAALLRHLSDTLSAEQNLGTINYIGGGAAGFTAQDA